MLVSLVALAGFEYVYMNQKVNNAENANMFEGSIKVYSGGQLLLSQKDALGQIAYYTVLCYMFNDTSSNCNNIVTSYFMSSFQSSCGYFLGGTYHTSSVIFRAGTTCFPVAIGLFSYSGTITAGTCNNLITTNGLSAVASSSFSYPAPYQITLTATWTPTLTTTGIYGVCLFFYNSHTATVITESISGSNYESLATTDFSTSQTATSGVPFTVQWTFGF
jgi:hypothetical protein